MNKKIKILLLTFYAPPDLSAGSFRVGALLDEARQRADEIEIDCLTTLPNRYQEFEAEAKEFEEADNVAIFRTKLPKHGNSMLGQVRSYLNYAWFVRQHMSSNRKDYDIVVATSSRLMTGALGAFCAMRMKKPLYLDIRDLFVDTMKGVFAKRKAKVILPIISLLEEWTFRRAKKINVVSEGFVEDVRSVAPNVEISVIPNGIDKEFLEPLPSKPAGERLKVLYAGNIGEGQGLELTVPSAAKKLDAIAEFHIVGSGGRLGALKENIAECGATNVYLHPPVSRSKVRELYKDADVLFLQLNDYPAFKKVLPSKLFEYAATEKPIIAAIPGYSASFAEENISGAIIAEPLDENALVESFLSLMNNGSSQTDRRDFVAKYDRRVLSKMLLDDIMNALEITR